MSVSESASSGDRSGIAEAASCIQRPIIMPELCSGEEGPFCDWLEHFEMCADLNGWKQDVRSKFLVVRLRGHAQEVYWGLEETSQQDYDKLKAALSEQLAPPGEENRYKSEFRARQQQKGETAAEVGRDIRRLARKAYPSLAIDTRDKLARDQFLDGLADASLRRCVILSHPKGLDDAIRSAVEYEIASRGPKGEQTRQETNSLTLQPREGTDQDRVAAALEANTAAMKEVLGAIQDLKGTGNPRSMSGGFGRGDRMGRRSITCWKCEQTGHVQAVCRNKTGGQLYGENTHGVSVTCESENSQGAQQTLDCHSLSPNPTVTRVQGTVDRIPIEILVDTGSAVTVISESLRSKLTRELVDYQQRNITSATGDPLSVSGVVTVDIGVGDLTAAHPAIVCQNITRDCIVGADFLRKHNLDVKFSTGTLNTTTTSTPLLIEDPESPPCRVAAQETVVVPAHHEMIRPATLTAEIKAKCGLVEMRHEYASRSPLVVARTLVDGTSGVVPVRVVNPTPHTITVYKHTHVGDFCTLQSLDGGSRVQNASCNAMGDAGRQCSTERDILELLKLDHLPEPYRKKVAPLLLEYEDVFSKHPGDLGRTRKVYHKISTGDADPIRQLPRRLPAHRQDEVRKHLDQMLEKDIIQPSDSPWAAPIVLVSKKDGSTRFCIDYRRLNTVTRKDAYPIPRIDDSLDALAGADFFSTLDLANGYWQVEVEPKDREKTAFTTTQGLFEFKVMPFGLCNGPGTFQRLMDTTLAGLQWSTCLVYLDDVIIYSRTLEEHVRRLRDVFQRFRSAGLKLKPTKCHLLKKSVEFLGHIVSGRGISTDPAKISCLQQWPSPACSDQVRSFLGLATYYGRFVKDFARISTPLRRLTEKNAQFAWSYDCEQAFQTLKRKLTSAPVLRFPEFDREFILDTDASDRAIGAVLSQRYEDGDHVIAFASRALTKAERRYSVTRKELLALVYSMKHFRHYLYGHHIIVRTDHSALQWLRSFREPEGQVARWLELLEEYDFEVQHRPGSQHCNADAMSRIPEHSQVNATAASCVIYPSRTHDEAASEDQWPFRRSSQQLRQAQTADENIKAVMEWLVSGVRPAFSDVRGASLETRSLWAQWNTLVVKDGILYRRVEAANGDSSHDQLVIPHGIREDILRSLHNDPSAGHLGHRRTLSRVRQRFYWPGLGRDVEEWCRRCSLCASRKTTGSKPRAPLTTVRAGYPMERIALDIMGPLPVTDRRNRYILVVGDYFTKWVEAFPIPDQEAKTVARVLFNEFICRFGTPEYIHTDQGRNFESSLFKELCTLLNVKKTRTTAYHPQSDGFIERFNRTLQTMLSMYVNDQQNDWDLNLQHVMMAYRSSTHETTGYTPIIYSPAERSLYLWTLCLGTRLRDHLSLESTRQGFEAV